MEVSNEDLQAMLVLNGRMAASMERLQADVENLTNIIRGGEHGVEESFVFKQAQNCKRLDTVEDNIVAILEEMNGSEEKGVEGIKPALKKMSDTSKGFIQGASWVGVVVLAMFGAFFYAIWEHIRGGH